MLKAERIAALLEEDPANENALVIVPKPDLSSPSRRGAASVDLRLGTWFTTLKPAHIDALTIDRQGPEPQLTRSHYVPFGGVYYLHPRNFVLGVTLEWLRLPSNLAGYVIGKSSWGRRGLIIATAVGVHPGFMGCLTLELTNVGEVPIAIQPGMPIGQLCLHDCGVASAAIDHSSFVGRRKPTLGQVKHDELSRVLTRAARPAGFASDGKP